MGMSCIAWSCPRRRIDLIQLWHLVGMQLLRLAAGNGNSPVLSGCHCVSRSSMVVSGGPVEDERHQGTRIDLHSTRQEVKPSAPEAHSSDGRPHVHTLARAGGSFALQWERQKTAPEQNSGICNGRSTTSSLHSGPHQELRALNHKLLTASGASRTWIGCSLPRLCLFRSLCRGADYSSLFAFVVATW